jgi:4-amino-4-deoxy-L-arabinose transferase-like glycosyltransferase
VIAGTFLFAATRRIFSSTAAAWTTLALFALNPNILYLQSIAMSEMPAFACLTALVYFAARFRDTQGTGALVGAGVAACLGTLCRYEGWFLLPFAALYFLIVARQKRVVTATIFCALAALGPLYWFGHNWWLTSDPLSFYRGPWSARAIQGKVDYPGNGNWLKAWDQFRAAAQLCSGPALPWMALAGTVVALSRRAWWALVLLALPGLFLVWSIHSSGTPIYVPHLWPNTWYNTRYGLAILPLMTLAAGALVLAAPQSARSGMAALVILAGTIHWAVYPRPDTWITWKESQVNSDARRAWTREAAAYMAANYRPGSAIMTSFGDLTGVFRAAGIPLRETFTGDNGIPFDALLLRPDLHLRHEWALVKGGDDVQTAIWKGPRFGKSYELVRQIVVKGAPVIEIYRR